MTPNRHFTETIPNESFSKCRSLRVLRRSTPGSDLFSQKRSRSARCLLTLWVSSLLQFTCAFVPCSRSSHWRDFLQRSEKIRAMVNGDRGLTPIEADLKSLHNLPSDGQPKRNTLSSRVSTSNLPSKYELSNLTSKQESSSIDMRRKENPSLLSDDDPVRWLVAVSDGKLPTLRENLPREIFHEPFLLRRLDDMYHVISHDETRFLKYIKEATTDNSNETTEGVYDRNEEQKTISVLRRSLEDAGFELLSRRDLELCDALNAGYLLRLTLRPDLGEFDPSIARDFYPERFNKDGQVVDNDLFMFEGRALVFWRGYSKEVTGGRLLLEKFDYLQTSIVQRSASSLKRRLDVIERWMAYQTISAMRYTTAATIRIVRLGLDHLPSRRVAKALRAKLRDNSSHKNKSLTGFENKPGKLFRLGRYGGSQARRASSLDPLDSLSPFVAIPKTATLTPNSSEPFNLDSGVNGNAGSSSIYDVLRCEYDESSNQDCPRVPTQLLERVSLGNLVDFFSREGRRTLLKKLVSKSELVEPTYERVVVVWRPLPKKPPPKPILTPPKILYELADMFDIDGLPELPKEQPTPPRAPLEIRTYDGVPMANLQAVLPKTKLIFRPADALVFDLVTVVSFLLVVGSQRFDNPKLDLIAIVSVALWLLRTIIRYSNKLARYDLLVKKFLTSRISHRNAGALKYVATEAGYQRAVRAALVHTWLMRRQEEHGPEKEEELIAIGSDAINKEVISNYKETPINMKSALNDLEDLELIQRSYDGDGDVVVVVISQSSRIKRRLRRVWGNLFEAKLQLGSLVGRRGGVEEDL